MIRLPTIRRAAYLFCIVVVVLLGGCGPELSQPSQNTPPTLMAIISPTVVHEPSKISPTLSTESQAATVEPIATAPMLRFDSWSPTSDFIAYWTFTAEEAAISYTNPPGSLSFLNARAGQSCLYPYKASSNTSLIWQSDGKIVILSGDMARLGTPCNNDFAVVANYESTTTPDPSLSPKGIYRATTATIRNYDETFNAATTIANMQTGNIESVVEWKHRGGLGELGLGGQWLTETQFLIHETLEQGPLIITIGQEAVPVVPDFFGAINLKDNVSLRATAATVTDTDTYHMILSGVGVEADFPEIRLYHSETNEVEQLPAWGLWGFSPDGKWLLFDKRPDKNGYESHEIWFRPVDPAGSATRRLVSGDSIYLAWSPDMTRIAVPSPQGISLLSFPDSAQVSFWETKDYQAIPIAWSPNGEYFAAYGYISGVRQEALFVIQAPMTTSP